MRKLFPRIYFCPDVIVIMWLGYEFIINRHWKDDWRF